MKVNVNDKYKFDVENLGSAIKINGSELPVDIRELSATRQHLIYQTRSYNVEFVANETDSSDTMIKVNGNLYRVNIEDQSAELLKQLGIDNLSSNKVQEIKAPMPGLVLNVIVAEGQEVVKGDSLLVLEAMKMENIIKSPSSGLIKKIFTQKGNKVEKNEILIQFA